MTSRDFFNSLFHGFRSHKQLWLKKASAFLTFLRNTVISRKTEVEHAQVSQIQKLDSLSNCCKDHIPTTEAIIEKQVQLFTLVKVFYSWRCSFYRNKCRHQFAFIAFPLIYWHCRFKVLSMKPIHSLWNF